MIERFMNPEISRRYMKDASMFGDLLFDAINLIGKQSRLHRLLVV